MGTGLVIAAALLASAAAGLFVYCALTALDEGWDISRLGWGRGRHTSHIPIHLPVRVPMQLHHLPVHVHRS